MRKQHKRSEDLDTAIHKSATSDYLQDQRKIKAAHILAYSGYCRDSKVRGAVDNAAKVAEVNRQTIYYWLNNDPIFISVIEEIKYELCVIAVRKIKKLARKGNVKACIFLAERLCPEMFSSQYKKFEYEKELLKLKSNLVAKSSNIKLQPPTIIIEGLDKKSPAYEKNKL